MGLLPKWILTSWMYDEARLMVYAKRRILKLRENPMATQPTHPAPKPQTPPPAPKPSDPHPPAAKAPAHPNADPQEAKAEGYKVDPVPPVQTIADEQRERSAEIEEQGVDAWKAVNDERSPDEKPKVVPGVSHRAVDESELRGNSTPAARTAQHPAAPR